MLEDLVNIRESLADMDASDNDEVNDVRSRVCDHLDNLIDEERAADAEVVTTLVDPDAPTMADDTDKVEFMLAVTKHEHRTFRYTHQAGTSVINITQISERTALLHDLLDAMLEQRLVWVWSRGQSAWVQATIVEIRPSGTVFVRQVGPTPGQSYPREPGEIRLTDPRGEGDKM